MPDDLQHYVLTLIQSLNGPFAIFINRGIAEGIMFEYRRLIKNSTSKDLYILKDFRCNSFHSNILNSFNHFYVFFFFCLLIVQSYLSSFTELMNPIRTAINTLNMKIAQYGFAEFYKNLDLHWENIKRNYKNSNPILDLDKELRPITLQYFQLYIVCYLIGVSVATVVFIIEILLPPKVEHN